VSVFGATGSVGKRALDFMALHPEKFIIDTITAHSSSAELCLLAERVNARHVVIVDEAGYADVKAALAHTSTSVATGQAALMEAAMRPVDVFLAAIVGAAGLETTFAALPHCDILALANKESLVCGGRLLLEQARQHNTTILPVDSEHSALFQLLQGQDRSSLSRLILTASGGAFRDTPASALASVTIADALQHPTWQMGDKITIDSATLMNKGLEVIEACYLFNLEEQDVDVVIHPSSIVHSLTQHHDGTTLAHMGYPDMITPIAYALSYPNRLATPVPALDLIQLGQLSFQAVDAEKARCLSLARRAWQEGHAAMIILNAANEKAVADFLDKRIGFLDIPRSIEVALDTQPRPSITCTADINALHNTIRQEATSTPRKKVYA
jgi:1-deoxy-D-xylulose-5-phosphate reductoisomerase